MKHRLPFLFVLLAGLMHCGCTDSDSSRSETSDASGSGSTAGDSKGTIGYSALSLTNPFFQIIADTMTAEAREHGYQVTVVSANEDVARQSEQIDEFIIQGVAAIVLNPADSASIGQAIKKANDAGIPVFTNDIKYTGDAGRVVSHVATDNLQGGRLAGEAMVRLLGESGGKVAVLNYPDVESCQMRTQGFHEIIDAHNATNGAAQIDVVSELNGGGKRDVGYAKTRDILTAHSDLVAIFAINDPSALGACSALEEAGLQDQITIIGFDGEKAGKEAILAGRILCDPIQFPRQMGRRTIELIIQHFDGEDVPDEELIPSKLYYRADAETDPELQTSSSHEKSNT
ncbi:MAG: substrate-binding domain-containing protein [Fuerstiella sp.]|nr:substrate-binding domain-containing protein [Fuerstiella sp.]